MYLLGEHSEDYSPEALDNEKDAMEMEPRNGTGEEDIAIAMNAAAQSEV